MIELSRIHFKSSDTYYVEVKRGSWLIFSYQLVDELDPLLLELEGMLEALGLEVEVNYQIIESS